jgi:hypothetical protein
MLFSSFCIVAAMVSEDVRNEKFAKQQPTTNNIKADDVIQEATNRNEKDVISISKEFANQKQSFQKCFLSKRN